MDNLTRRKMSKKELKIVDAIVEKASKRRHKKQYTVKFICEYLEDHSYFKGYDYECKADAMDMLRSITKVLVTLKYFTEKQAKEHIEYYKKEMVEQWFPDD